MQVGDRVAFPATGEHGVVVGTDVWQEGTPWAETRLVVRVDGNDLCDFSVHERAVVREDEIEDTPPEAAELLGAPNEELEAT